MTRRIWIIVTAVTLSVAAIGGVAAFAGGGAEDDQNLSPSLGIPDPGSDGINQTEVTDGNGLDVEILPKYDGPADGPPPITEGPTEEPGTELSMDPEEGVSSLEGGTVTNGEFSGNQGEVIDGGVSTSSGMAVPGFEGLVTDTVVVVEPTP